MGYNPNQGFSLPTPKNFRGRAGAAIPTAGIVLPAAKGGSGATTYAASNLPSGLSFDATTRAITGSPTTAHATRAVVYTATDSSTPAEVTNVTFQFPVAASTAALTRDDFDHRGYGLSTRTVYLLALLQGTVAVGSGNVTVWRRPPDGAAIGLLLDDDGNALTDTSDITIVGGGQSLFVNRATFFVSQDRIELRESNVPDVHFGTFISSTLGSPEMTLQIGTAENTISYERGFSASSQWRRSSPDLGGFLQTFDGGVRMLLAISSA